jgi:hypothetical protein
MNPRDSRSTDVPDKAEIRVLLERYFEGPITDTHVDRVEEAMRDHRR